LPDFNIVKETEATKSFRVAAVMSAFDLQTSHIKEQFSGSIDLSEPWNIGLIVGGSGTGKSTIAKELFASNYVKQYDYNSQCVLDDMPKGKSIEEITSAFSSVGFSSPPSWLKSYSVLSMGEKMRCDLARAILEEKELIVFDEFTSVVDRIVAKTGSFAINKAIKRLNKKFIAVSCHRDIIEWLQPDWIFDTDKMKFFRHEGKRPEMRCEVVQLDKGKDLWQKFRQYHYLNTDLNISANCFALMYEDRAIGFCAIIHTPHPKSKMFKRVHRLVILPEYQGLGLGTKFVSFIGGLYAKQGYDFRITSSTKSIYNSLLNKRNWLLVHVGRNAPHHGHSHGMSMSRTKSSARVTRSFKYVISL
jgi:GNAT superfamily N-acetyltransferase